MEVGGEELPCHFFTLCTTNVACLVHYFDKFRGMGNQRFVLAAVLSLSVLVRAHWPSTNRWLSIRAGDNFGLNNIFGDGNKEGSDSSLPDIDSLFGDGGGKL